MASGMGTLEPDMVDTGVPVVGDHIANIPEEEMSLLAFCETNLQTDEVLAFWRENYSTAGKYREQEDRMFDLWKEGVRRLEMTEKRHKASRKTLQVEVDKLREQL